MVGEDTKKTTWRHQVLLVDREELTIDGVLNLGSFDEEEVIVETEQGILAVRGEGMNIKQLNLDAGNVIIDGLVRELSYEDTPQNHKGKSIITRLFK